MLVTTTHISKLITLLQDTYRHKGMRLQLVEELAEAGIEDENVLRAILKIPRHFFFDPAFVEKAYENKAFPIGEGQTISQPYTVAYQSQMLALQKGEKVLEIGTGSGYQACVLAAMGARVVSIERNKRLYQKAKSLLRKMGYRNISTIFGDGYEGAAGHAPFDKIIITAAAPYVPNALIAQLKIGGMMVIPVGPKTSQQMLRIRKITDNEYQQEGGSHFKFVPMLEGTVSKEKRVFE